MRVHVLGRKGMLGRYVYTYLRDRYEVLGYSRKDFDAENIDMDDLPFKNGSVVINCIGIIKRSDVSKAEFAIVNAAFPHILENICLSCEAKLIHVTTDCVFDGLAGNYDEQFPHNATDIYGVSKSLGEPENSTVIRTSIIGEEVGQSRSLVEWIKSQAGKEVNGFTNHFWNGITCLQFAKVCEEIIEKDLFWEGVKHITSPTSVSKFELVKMVSDIYNLNVKVNPFETPTKCDRTLSSVREDVSIEVPELKEQVEEMSKFNLF